MSKSARKKQASASNHSNTSDEDVDNVINKRKTNQSKKSQNDDTYTQTISESPTLNKTNNISNNKLEQLAFENDTNNETVIENKHVKKSINRDKMIKKMTAMYNELKCEI